jgi:hypothetical protein
MSGGTLETWAISRTRVARRTGYVTKAAVLASPGVKRQRVDHESDVIQREIKAGE